MINDEMMAWIGPLNILHNGKIVYFGCNIIQKLYFLTPLL